MEQSEKSSCTRPPLPRDPRGSLEVFNPSAKASKSPLRSQHSWKTWIEQQSSSNEPHQSHNSISNSTPSDETANTSWMALKDPDPLAAAAAAAQRAAGWGLVLKTDAETGTPQGVAVRSSGGCPRRDSNNSVRSSGDSSSDGRELRGIPRVSEDLRDALAAFQQTFVVSDATKPDYPIMYASGGFFNMTGYTSKEVIGRNWYASFFLLSSLKPFSKFFCFLILLDEMK